MDSKTLAYIIYMVSLFYAGFTMADVGLNLRDARYWTLLILYIIVYICGYANGFLN